MLNFYRVRHKYAGGRDEWVYHATQLATDPASIEEFHHEHYDWEADPDGYRGVDVEAVALEELPDGWLDNAIRLVELRVRALTLYAASLRATAAKGDE